MHHISLFTGIGGFDYAAQCMGWKNLASCEINPFNRRILQYYWPDTYHHDDVKTFTYQILNNELTKKYGANWRTDKIVLSGGFPCQPYSVAGERLGTEDERHLWPEMLRTVREVRPGYVVGENVRGLTNWNGGMVFDQVQADLENEGYEVLPFLLPACAVNAPHRRDRIWFIAKNTNQDGRRSIEREKESNIRRLRDLSAGDPSNTDKFNGDVSGFHTGKIPQQQSSGIFGNTSADSTGNGLQGRSNGGELREPREIRKQRLENMGGLSGADWQNFPTQSPVCNGNDGLSLQLDGITFSKWRQQSIMAAGNAIVPQLAMQIFKAIEEVERKM